MRALLAASSSAVRQRRRTLAALSLALAYSYSFPQSLQMPLERLLQLRIVTR